MNMTKGKSLAKKGLTKQDEIENRRVIDTILRRLTFDVPLLAEGARVSPARVRHVLWHLEEFQRVQDPAILKQGGLQIYAEKPGELLAMDTMITPGYLQGSPNKDAYITIVDVHSRVCMLWGTDDVVPSQATGLLKDWIAKYRKKPKRIIVDEGGEFKGQFLTYCKQRGIQVLSHNASKGRGNALAHVNSVHRYLRTKTRDAVQILGSKAFHEALETILYEYNNKKKHSSTGARPADIMAGRARSKEKRRSAVPGYPVGTHVRMRLPIKRNEKRSLKIKWSDEIYRVVADFGGLMYVRELGTGKGEAGAKLLSGSKRRFMPVPQETYSLEDFRTEKKPRHREVISVADQRLLDEVKDTEGYKGAPERPRGRKRRAPVRYGFE